jgi:PAS domain S-box-containing protein
MLSKPIRQPELSEIQTFVLAVEHGSISAAAKRLRISAAAATKRLNNLDVISRGKLLERTSRGVQVTALGQRLLPSARRWLRDAEMLLSGLSAARPRPLDGLHRILHGGGPAPAEDLVTDLEALLAYIFRGASEPLLIADADGTVIDANPAYCRMTGREQITLVGRPVPGLEPFATQEPAGDTVPARVQTEEGEFRALGYSLQPIEVAQLPLLLIRAGDCEPISEGV